MKHILAQQPRRTAPTSRRVSHPSNSGLLFLSYFSLSQPHSPSSLYHSSPSYPSLFMVLLLVFAFLQTPHLTKAKAVSKSKNNGQVESVMISPTNSHFSLSCDGDNGIEDPLTQQVVTQELKRRMSEHHGFDETGSFSSETATLLNGTHPEGRKVRQRLRNLVKNRDGALQGDTNRAKFVMPAHGTQVEKYVFYSSERNLQLPVRTSNDVIAENDPLSVVTFKTGFRLPQEIYHDLIIKSAVLRMRISQSKASLCHTLTSSGMHLTADIYLLESRTSMETDVKNLNDTVLEQATLLKSVKLRPESDSLVTVKIQISLLEHLIDSDTGAVALAVKVRADTSQLNSEKISSYLAFVSKNRKIKYSKRKLRDSVSMFVQPPSSSLPLLKKLSSRLLAPSVVGSTVSTTSSPSLSSSSSTPNEVTASSERLSSRQLPSSADPKEHLVSSCSLMVSEASLELRVMTEDLRHDMETISRTRRSTNRRDGYRNRGRREDRNRDRRRSRGRDRGCRGGYCCLKYTEVNINGVFVWNNERHFLLTSKYKVSYCAGRCRAGYNTDSNIGDFLGQLHRRHPKQVPGPSCIPDDLGPMLIYVTNSEGYPVPRRVPDMQIESCKCL
ncbi:transforming growth factor beta-2 [Elysia marginata]|uniref:Transforming growth factor beta-2 n=1 Tax=Elysia marginata TaxID=1093978 RepID=A0AAV4HWT5_9GAST|nr:transforming growth factor beta-2 [Elysia marginata]